MSFFFFFPIFFLFRGPLKLYLYVVISDHSAIPAMDPWARFILKALVIAKNSIWCFQMARKHFLKIFYSFIFSRNLNMWYSSMASWGESNIQLSSLTHNALRHYSALCIHDSSLPCLAFIPPYHISPSWTIYLADHFEPWTLFVPLTAWPSSVPTKGFLYAVMQIQRQIPCTSPNTCSYF